jgi:hypothetical protein
MSAEVTLRQLGYFVVLGEELNCRRAAEKLFISQPALSTAIKQLNAVGHPPGCVAAGLSDRHRRAAAGRVSKSGTYRSS